MKRRGRAKLTGLMVLLAVAVSAVAVAQDPPREQRKGPIKPEEKKEAQEPYALRVDVPLVNVDVTVADNRGNIVQGLQQDHFRVFVDGKEQEVVAFAPSESSLTTVLLVEATPAIGYLLWDNLDAAWLFLRQLRKEDWIALVAYDMKPRIEVDFTQDRNEVMQRLRMMYSGAGLFSEANMYDAVADTLERLKDIEGKKSIVLIGTGIDTFSKFNWGEIRDIARQHRTTIFAVGMTWTLQLYYDRADAAGYRTGPARLTVNMAEAQMKDLAEQTGGRAYFPRFLTELPSIYGAIGAMLRQQYSLAFRPRDLKPDGKFHKIEVKLLGPDGKKLKVVNQDGKEIKYKVYARRGFYAPAA